MNATEPGALAIWHDVEPEAEAMVNDWYNRQHHPERVGVPGFLSARRYAAVSGAPKYFILYATRGVPVLTSPDYLERLDHPTEWTRRVMPHFRNMTRTVCRLVLRLGLGEGGAAGAWRLAAQPGHDEALMGWLRAEALPTIAGLPGIVSLMLLRGDPGASGLSSRERKLRAGSDHLADIVVVVTGNDPQAIERVRMQPLGDTELAAHGAAPDGAFGIYRLIFALSAPL